jgi:hypothetical protein
MFVSDGLSTALAADIWRTLQPEPEQTIAAAVIIAAEVKSDNNCARTSARMEERSPVQNANNGASTGAIRRDR